MSNKNICSTTAGSDLLLDDSIQLWILHLREALANTSNEVDQKLEGSENHIIHGGGGEAPGPEGGRG